MFHLGWHLAGKRNSRRRRILVRFPYRSGVAQRREQWLERRIQQHCEQLRGFVVHPETAGVANRRRLR